MALVEDTPCWYCCAHFGLKKILPPDILKHLAHIVTLINLETRLATAAFLEVLKLLTLNA